MTWLPHPRADVDLTSLPLDAQQGYLLSRLDGMTDVSTLASLTGFAPDQVTSMLNELVTLGAVSAAGVPASAPAAAPAMETPPADTEPEPLEASEDESEAPEEADPEQSSERSATHRQLFETQLHGRTVDERAALAQTAEEPELSAYCFDPMPQVVAALLENSRFGGVHARLIAAHHRTSAGLEALASRAAFAHDGGVRRALLRNPVLPPSLYRRLWSNQRLQQQYLVATSKECPEQTRTMARELLRASFTQRAGDERAELIVTTEGRCLALLPTATLDGQATALLCRRTYTSTLFIQNLARWSACPPALVAHLRRQDLVRRNTVLRQMLERHPNAS
jgi:hypothetical protein